MKFAPTNNIPLPDGFLDGFTALDSIQKQELVEALDQQPPVSVRLNPDKGLEAVEAVDNSAVAWCQTGRYLAHRPVFTLDPAHHSGAYYVQEAGSMFIEQLVVQGACAQQQPLRVLDLCASPGGKSTLLSSLVDKGTLVVANEVIRARTSILAENVRRWGKGNTAVCSNDAKHFSKLESFFDLIVVDAPCSGEGMFRKDNKSRSEWSQQSVELCAARQRRILSDIWPALKVGGTLIYSTCTFNEKENEDNVRWMVDNFYTQPLHITTQDSWGVMRGEASGIETFRFLPHKTQSEGFFAAILQKTGSGSPTLTQEVEQDNIQQSSRQRNDKRKNNKQGGSAPREIFSKVTTAQQQQLSRYVKNPEQMHFAKIADSCFAFDKQSFQELQFVAEQLNVCYSGVAMGRFFGDEFKPEHALALYSDLNTDNLATADLTLEQAREYLRKNPLDAELFTEGINLVCYRNTPIGWLKRSGTRTTNMLPKELRILNL